MTPRIVGPGFHEQVYALVRQVPAGRVTTYGDVAAALGDVAVSRHVGWALAALREEDVPWHRVINRLGTISFRGDTARGEAQRRLLEAEGVTFDTKGRVELKGLRWRPGIGEVG